jgi:hypothetical protein
MQDETISGLGAANLPLTGTELIVLVQDGVTKKTGLDNLPEQLNSNELEAVQNANAPTGVNPFATIADLPLSGIFYPITNAVLSANVVSVGGSSYAQYFVSGKSMILGVFFEQLDIDFDADTNASILIDLPTDTSYSAYTASGSASIIFSTAPTAAATPVFSNCVYGSSGKIEIKLQNYGGEVSDIYDITATFVIELT